MEPIGTTVEVDHPDVVTSGGTVPGQPGTGDVSLRVRSVALIHPDADDPIWLVRHQPATSGECSPTFPFSSFLAIHVTVPEYVPSCI